MIEQGRRLSESLIWALQRGFYARAGLAAWKPKAVPFYITSNAFTARAYARTVAGFLRDLVAAGRDRSRGAAVTWSSWRPARASSRTSSSGGWRRSRTQVPALGGLDLPLRDERLRGEQRRGVADPRAARAVPRFGPPRLRAVRPGARPRAAAARRRRHVVGGVGGATRSSLLANYAFDSTTQDAFQVTDGVLQERLARVLLDAGGAGPGTTPTYSSASRSATTWRPSGAARYDDPRPPLAARGAIGASYREASFLLPVGAFRCLRTFESISRADVYLLLTGDKAVTRDGRDRAREGDPTFYVHAGGAFSFLANLHALSRYFEEAGGTALNVDRRDQRLQGRRR